MWPFAEGEVGTGWGAANWTAVGEWASASPFSSCIQTGLCSCSSGSSPPCHDNHIASASMDSRLPAAR